MSGERKCPACGLSKPTGDERARVGAAIAAMSVSLGMVNRDGVVGAAALIGLRPRCYWTSEEACREESLSLVRHEIRHFFGSPCRENTPPGTPIKSCLCQIGPGGFMWGPTPRSNASEHDAGCPLGTAKP